MSFKRFTRGTVSKHLHAKVVMVTNYSLMISLGRVSPSKSAEFMHALNASLIVSIDQEIFPANTINQLLFACEKISRLELIRERLVVANISCHDPDYIFILIAKDSRRKPI